MILKGMPKIDFFGAVVGYCYTLDGRLILLQKRDDNKRYSGLLGTPAGKMEKGETPTEAMLREIMEETGFVIEEEHLTYVGKTDHCHIVGKEPEKNSIYFECHTFFSKPVFHPDKIVLDFDEHQKKIFINPGLLKRINQNLIIPDTLELYEMAKQKGAI
jgi:8-oxo-dGTP pyrophosphatase MutT (NUDIX family)